MGADVTLYTKDNERNFRDAYNSTNLAWVIGLSYWKDGKNKKSFMKKLSQITNKEIEDYVDKLHENPKKSNIEPDRQGWINMFKEKRDTLKKVFDKGVVKVIWSV